MVKSFCRAFTVHTPENVDFETTTKCYKGNNKVQNEKKWRGNSKIYKDFLISAVGNKDIKLK